MAWTYLLLAGLLEVAWAFGLKASAGLTRPLPSLLTLLGAGGSFWLLALALRDLPLGTAYAIWTGIGAVGAFALGVLLLGEAATLGRVASAGLILAGIAGLKLSSG